MNIRIIFAMDGQNIRPGFNKSFYMFFRLDNHQMDIQRKRCDLSNSFDKRESQRQIGDKNAIHDIDVNPIGP